MYRRREGEDEMLTRLSAAVLASVAASTIFMIPTASAQIVVHAPARDVRIERVGYYDLNLASRSGEQILYRRVNGAVQRVCLYDEGRWYGLSEPGYNSCAEGAWRGARPQVIGAVYRARLQAYGRGY
jgi:UrcA family protein